jgi:type VI secretion system secreted protein VgrG
MPRVMEITTPLGDDVLLFHRMHAREELGRLSEFQLDLLSKKSDIKIDDILGKNVTVTLALPDDTPRHFNGYVTRFVAGGRAYGRYQQYRAIVRPWLWFLTRTADCRIFQEMTVPDIIGKVFGDHGMADFALELTARYRKWTYCVQYRESDFNFLSRLMEQEGIYYYVRHTAGHNTVVLTDSTSKHTPTDGYQKMSFISPEQVVAPELERISSWDSAREVQPGVYVHDDYDLERPSVELKTRQVLPRGYSPSDYEIYDYPGLYIQKADGQQYADVRIDEFGSQFETSQAVTNAKGVTVGSLFTLEDCPREEQNREHLIVAATYDLEFSEYEALPQHAGAGYHCSFVAMSSEQQFRPRRATPKPFVQGPQTAVVVGPAGDDIYTDKYGRVKVQFHWDRLGKKDENSSCWIRVSSPWAGKAWGTISTPRIGQEVVVDFLEGDPDQPIITGRFYNAEQMPPYELPANKTQSGMKSRSSLGGAPANFNEIRFEDKMGSEQLFIHAEKNQDIEVEHDETHWVGHDRTKTIDHDETSHIKHDRTETVDNNETITVHGARTETVDKDETITIHANRTETVDKNETITITGNRSISVSKSETATVTLQRTHSVGINETISVGAAQEINVGALQSVTVGAAQTISVGASQSTTVGAAQTLKVGGAQNVDVAGAANLKVGGDQTHQIAGARTSSIGKDDTIGVGKNLVINAGDAITIKTGDASITMKKDGTITIKGKDISITGSGKISIKADSDVVVKGSKVGVN